MKLNCIIDTCSCIVLSNSEFNQKSLLRLLNDVAKLSYSKEIEVELRDHMDKKLPAFILDKRRKLSPGKYTNEEYEIRMLGSPIKSREKKGDKGEIDNFILSVDQIHNYKQSLLIFITDDKIALRGILADWVKSFPAINVWTSYEVVLFLYAEDIIPSKEMAIEKIQDIISFTAPTPANRSPKTAQELIALKRDYSNRITKISALLK